MTASTTPGLVGTALWGGTQLTEHAGNLKAEVMGAPEILSFLPSWSQLERAGLGPQVQETSEQPVAAASPQ